MTTINAIGTQWWRFDKYELRDGLIRPAGRSSLKVYDLWKTYTDRKVEAEKPEGRSRRVKKHPRRFKSGPLESLLTLAGRIRFRPEFVLGQWAGPAGSQYEDDSIQAILDWCAQFGLLGILPHRLDRIRLWPYWHTEDGRTSITTTSIVRTEDGFASLVTRLGPTNAAPGTEGSQVEADMVPDGIYPEVIWRSTIFSRIQRTEAHRGLLSLEAYFPEMKAVPEADRFAICQPLTEPFWRQYAEPIDEFVSVAITIRNFVMTMSGFPDMSITQSPLDDLNGLTSQVRMAITKTRQGYRLVFKLPSLIAGIGEMWAQDLLGHRRAAKCEACGEAFITQAYQSRYCSDPCRWRTQKREIREDRLKLLRKSRRGAKVDGGGK
jgi:hypothetical protein